MYFWEVIDRIYGSNLRHRSRELRNALEELSNEELLEFHREANNAFDRIFSPLTYHVYCALFCGEVNGEGFRDFCSNLILCGSAFCGLFNSDPDSLASGGSLDEFNDEPGTPISDLASEILGHRLGLEDADTLIYIYDGVRNFDGWERLATEVGNMDFNPQWDVIKRVLPQVYEVYGPRES
jgi:hypothetical protein